MADLKISQLPAITVTTDTDIFPIVQSGVTSKITVANLKASSAEVQAGTQDQRFTTPKKLHDAGLGDVLVNQILS